VRGVETTPMEEERPMREKKKVRFYIAIEVVEDKV
jgi:hypothetical protein